MDSPSLVAFRPVLAVDSTTFLPRQLLSQTHSSVAALRIKVQVFTGIPVTKHPLHICSKAASSQATQLLLHLAMMSILTGARATTIISSLMLPVTLTELISFVCIPTVTIFRVSPSAMWHKPQAVWRAVRHQRHPNAQQ